MRRLTRVERAAALPAASVLATRSRAASLPCLESPAEPRARRIETVEDCPGWRLLVFEPSTRIALTFPGRIAIVVCRARVVRQPPVWAAGHDTGTRATSLPWLRATVSAPISGSS